MIECWDPPVLSPNIHLKLRIASALAQVGDVEVSGVYSGKAHTELDSHANMYVVGKHYYLLSELSLFSNPRFEKAGPQRITHVESYVTCTRAPLSLLLPLGVRPVAYPRQWRMM